MPTSPFSTSNLHTGDARVRQVYEMLDIMSPQEVPFLKMVGINGEAGENPKIEWLEDTLLAETSALNGAISSTTATTFAVTSGHGIHFQPFEIVKVDNEYMYVTDVTSDTLTVVRGVCGTTAATHLTLATVEIVGLANRENVDAPASGTTDMTIPYNYFQAFDVAYQISEISRNTKAYGVPQGEDARELSKKFKEVTVKLERNAFLGKRAAASGSVPQTMGGLTYFFSSDYSSQYYSTDLNGDQLQEKHINDMLQDRFYADRRLGRLSNTG